MYNAEKNKQIHIIIPKRLYEKIVEQAGAMSISVASLIKIAINEYLNKTNN